MARTITVKGTGSVSAKPDYIIISMEIDEVNKDYNLAMEGAAQRIEKLQQVVESCGYCKEDLKTTSFSVDIRFESVKDKQGNYKRVFSGYACNYKLKLSFDFDNRQLAKVISKIAASSVKPELGINFTVKDVAKVKEELLTAAANNARKKAEILSKASGCELGQLQSIDYNWGEIDIYSNTHYSVEKCLQPMIAEREMPEIDPDDIDLADSVTFVWELK